MRDREVDTEESMFVMDVGGIVDSTITSDAGGDELSELRRRLDEAEPRLEAFAALEALAKRQVTTPEAVAIQAAMEVLEAATVEAGAELERLQATHDELLQEHAAVADELAEMLDELELIRADAVRLLGEKAELELKVEAVRNDLSAERDSRELISAKSRATVIDMMHDDEEATAFDRFFDADVEEDKARAWMLE